MSILKYAIIMLIAVAVVISVCFLLSKDPQKELENNIREIEAIIEAHNDNNDEMAEKINEWIESHNLKTYVRCDNVIYERNPAWRAKWVEATREYREEFRRILERVADESYARVKGVAR